MDALGVPTRAPRDFLFGSHGAITLLDG
jgi:hypothetical protein